jgi:para-aminobenzoate synthetase component 1
VNKLPNNINISIAPLWLHNKITAEKLSAEALFTPLANQPWAIWLDSCNSDHIDSRFDILVWQPEVTLSTYGELTHIQHANNPIKISKEHPLELITLVTKEIFDQYTLPNSKDQLAITLPFIGGALGYFAYDLGRRFEQLPSTAQQDIALPDMAVGIYTQAVIFDRQSQCCYLVCPDDKRAEITAQLTSKSGINQAVDRFKLTSAWQSNISKKQYTEKFKQVHDYLLSGDCYQINLAQRFSADYQGDEFAAYQALRVSNNAPFSAFMRLNDAAILSISPERFLSVKSNKVQSKPIKGTCARDGNPIIDQQNAKWLQQSSKDRAENVMIVDLLRNDISKVCKAGTVVVPQLFAIESFAAVHHLVSTVEGELANKYSNTDLLGAAFPGGSITGAPKIRAMEIIEELEPHRRSVYCGSMGYISACGNMDTSITIRTLVCQNSLIHCWAGGGLVADSTLESEYQETFDKVQKILPVLSKL